MLYFKASKEKLNECIVVNTLNAYPVKTIRRENRPIVTNVSVDTNWNKLSTYDLFLQLVEHFIELDGNADYGLCSYLAQCLVNPMVEAKRETRSSICDLSMICCYDFILHNGRIVTSEEICAKIFPYFTIVDWVDGKDNVEIKVELNVK